jgi:hypothetical protein
LGDLVVQRCTLTKLDDRNREVHLLAMLDEAASELMSWSSSGMYRALRRFMTNRAAGLDILQSSTLSMSRGWPHSPGCPLDTTCASLRVRERTRRHRPGNALHRL